MYEEFKHHILVCTEVVEGKVSPEFTKTLKLAGITQNQFKTTAQKDDIATAMADVTFGLAEYFEVPLEEARLLVKEVTQERAQAILKEDILRGLTTSFAAAGIDPEVAQQKIPEFAERLSEIPLSFWEGEEDEKSRVVFQTFLKEVEFLAVQKPESVPLQ